MCKVKLTSMMAMVWLLCSCYVGNDREEQSAQAKGLGDAEATTLILKYAFTNERTKKRVIQIIKITYDSGDDVQTPQVYNIEVKNPADQDPAEFIEMEFVEQDVNEGVYFIKFGGSDANNNNYEIKLTNSGDGYTIFPTIVTKNGDGLEGELWDKLSEERWEKHTNGSFTKPSSVPVTDNDLASLASKCYSSNASVSDGGFKFTYTRSECDNQKMVFSFGKNNLRGILNCIKSCDSESFGVEGKTYGLGCDSKEVKINYDKGGLKITTKDTDGLTDVMYTEDC